MVFSVVTPRRLQMLRWYARRPRLWRQFLRFVQARQRSEPPAAIAAARAEATAWADARAVAPEEALEQLTGSRTLLSLAAACPEEVAAGRQQQHACPVKMGSGADGDLLYTLAERIRCMAAIETGVAFGWSSFALLQSLAPRGAHLISTDMPYPLRDNDAYVGCVVPARLRPHWTLLRVPDRDGLPVALRRLPRIDLCHYDSDKSEAGRAWAYPRLWAALRPGGLFVTDDVQDNLEYARFVAAHAGESFVLRVPDRIGWKFAGVMRKA